MSAHSSSRSSQADTPYESLLAIVTALLIVHLWLHQAWALPLAVGLALAGLLIKAVARWVHLGWQYLSRALGWVMSRLILSVVFFVFLTPIAWLYRLFSRNPLQLKRQPDSYFFVREHEYESRDLKDPW